VAREGVMGEQGPRHAKATYIYLLFVTDLQLLSTCAS
jgi:hypothetical protein